jgi:hypothetical protein
MCLFGAMLSMQPALAAGGNGTGGGGGGGTGGGSNPLTLSGAFLTTINGNASSTGAALSGTSDFPLQGTIKLVFSLNVVDSTVWPSPNQSAFSLADAGGNPVSINVTRIDPAANDAEKDNVFVTPVNPLTAGTQYILTIAPTLTGANGNTLGQAATVSFGTKPAEPPLIATQAAKKPAAKPAAKGSSTVWYVLGAIVLLALLLGAWLWFRRARGNKK